MRTRSLRPIALFAALLLCACAAVWWPFGMLGHNVQDWLAAMEVYADDYPTPPRITYVEINQAVGNQYDFTRGTLAPAVKFVAGKSTVVRVHLSTAIVPDVFRPEVAIWRDGAYVTTLSAAGSTPTSTLLFACPDFAACGNWRAGVYTFVASISSTIPSQWEVRFEERRPLHILAVPVKIKVDGKVKSVQNPGWKTAWEFMSKTYPVADGTRGVKWDWSPEYDATAEQPFTQDSARGLINGFNLPLTLACLTGGPCYDAVIYFLPTGPLDGAPGGSSLYSKAAFVCTEGNDCAPILQQIVAHEVGHVLNTGVWSSELTLGDEYDDEAAQRKCSVNPPPYRAQFGDCGEHPDVTPWPLDRKAGSAVASNANAFDVSRLTPMVDKLSFMGGASNLAQSTGDYWVTPRIFSYLFDQLKPESLTATKTEVQDAVLVEGTIYRDGSASLAPSYRVQAPSLPGGTGNYVLEGLDAGGSVLMARNFDVSFFLLTNPPREVDSAPFLVAAPFPSGTKTLRIRRLAVDAGAANGAEEAARVIAEVAVSAHAPVVQVTAPSAGQPVSGMTTVAWQSSDADGDPLHHLVEYSADGWAWRTLAANQSASQLAVNFDELPGSGEAYIRVTVSDGVNTAQATSAPFAVALKRPSAFILSPRSGDTIPPGAPVLLQGSAYDLEDGWLEASGSMQWSSDRDGVLGAGGQLAVRLSPGEHVITYRATDIDGNVAKAQTRITVGVRLFLSAIWRRSSGGGRE